MQISQETFSLKLGYCKKQPLKQLFFKKQILTNLCRTLDNIFKSCISIDFLRIVGRGIFRPQSKGFEGLEGFVQDDPWEELAIAHVVECLARTSGKTITNKLAVSSATDTLLKTQIFVDVFLKEGYEYAALREELLIWESPTYKFYQYLPQFTYALLFCHTVVL